MESQEQLMKKWVKVYPIYIDKAVKLSEGRKVNANLSIEKPTTSDIHAVCSQFLNLKSKIENNSHPKDWMKRGRVIIELKTSDKQPLNKEVLTKHQLLKVICETLLKHKQKETETAPDEKKRKKRKK